MSELKPYKRKGTQPDAAADFCDQVFSVPILSGSLLTVTTDGTTNINYFKHGLGKPYTGVFNVGQNQTSITIRPMSPEDMKAVGTKDPREWFGIRASSATAVTVKAWVF